MEHTYTNQNEFLVEATKKKGLTIVGANSKMEQIFWMLRSCKDMASFDTQVSILANEIHTREIAKILSSAVPNVSQNDPSLKNITLHTDFLSDELETIIKYEVFQNNTKVFFLEGFDYELTDSPSLHAHCEQFLQFCKNLTQKYDIHIILLKKLFLKSLEEGQSPSLYHFGFTSSLLHFFHHIIRLETKEKDVLKTYFLKPQIDSVFEEPFPV